MRQFRTRHDERLQSEDQHSEHQHSEHPVGAGTAGLGHWRDPVVSRRVVLGAAAGATALTLAGAGSAREAHAARLAAAEQLGRLGAGTDFSVRVSPDGSTLALDLLGVLWTYSSSGGDATRLTSDLYDIAQPDWAPDGRTIVFQSYRDGVFNLWTITPDGTQARQLTQGPYDHREPRYSPDGRYIAFSSDLRGSYGVYTYDTTTGVIRAVVETTEEEYEPTWSPDGKRIAFVVADTRVDVVDVATSARSTLVSVPAGQVIHQPQFLPDGSTVAYHLFHAGLNDIMVGTTALVAGEEAFPFRVSFAGGGRVLLHVRRQGPPPGARLDRRAGDGRVHRGRLDRDPRVCEEAAGLRLHETPAGGGDRQSRDLAGRGSVAFRALNDIYVGRLGKKPEPLFNDRWWKSDPDWSPDGRRLAYASDRTGTLNLWVRDLQSGTDQQVTFFTESAAVSCRWSPDGRMLAYLDQNGAVWTWTSRAATSSRSSRRPSSRAGRPGPRTATSSRSRRSSRTPAATARVSARSWSSPAYRRGDLRRPAPDRSLQTAATTGRCGRRTGRCSSSRGERALGPAGRE